MTAIVAAFLNQSSLVTDSDCLKWAIACAKQARSHAAPLWGWETPQLVFLPDASFAGADMDLIYVFDDADAAGALGYHDVTPDGRPYAKIFARDCLKNGVSISSCLSHELLELCGDPTCDAWRLAHDGFEYALELCDAVEAFTYMLDGVEVSDFVLPSFFGMASGGEPFDFLSKLTSTFQTGAGGYQIRRDPKTGDTTQVYGEGRAEWRAPGKAHPAARTFKRGAK